MKYKFIFSIVVLILIAYFDWMTGVVLSYSFLYFIPLVYIALQKESRVLYIVLNAIVALASWNVVFIVHTGSVVGTDLLFNSFLRLLLYLFVPYMIMLNRKQKSELELKNDQLEKINAEKNQLLGVAAHDIRSIASGINSFSSLINNEEDILNIKKYGSIIYDSSERLIHLVTYLLDISKIESGTINLKLKEGNYIKFLKNRIEFFSIIAEKKNISIILNTPSDNISFKFDQTYLAEVIDNLLSNAIKYSHQNSYIKVNVLPITDNVLTEVVDQGVGISKNEIGNIFEPFNKTSNKPTGNETSTGLGLAIAKKIVTLHRGSIGVSSIKANGATFYFTIPIGNEID